MPVYKRSVNSLAKSGSSKLKGDITLSEGTGVTLTQSGQDISIAASGGSGSGDMLASTYDPNSVASDAFDMDNMAQGTTNKFVTATELTVLGNTSGTNTGDNSANTTYAADYRATNFIAGTDYLAPTGSAAALTSFPTLNQNTTGSAATLTTSRTFQTNLASTSAVSFNGSANNSHGVTGTLPVANGGTGRATATTAYGVIAAGTTATGAQQTISPGTSGYVLTSNGTSALPTFQAAASGGLTWSAITTNTTATVNNGYISNSSSLLTVTLPSTATVGSIVRVAGGAGIGGWTIAQPTGAKIVFGNLTTTTGTGGSLTGVFNNDAVELLCIVANTTWTVISSQGNLTVA